MSNFDLVSTSERLIIDFDRFSIPEVHRLGRYAYKHAHESLPAHAHHGMIEICYCEKGLQVYEVNGQKYHIKGGDVFITFPGELHSTAQHPEEKGSLYWMILDVTGRNSFLNWQGADASAFIQALLELPGRHFPGGTAVKKMLDSIFVLSSAPRRPLLRVELISQLTGFLLAIVQRSKTSAARQPSGRRAEISAYISDHLYHDLSVESLAARIHYSASHFKSWFKHEFGMPPADYILRLRIEEAKKLLHKEGPSTISDAAYHLNFSSAQYFSTVFKKYTGVTPTEYRSLLTVV